MLGASGAAGAFNHYYERDSDRKMARTSSRPFASGLLKPGPVWPVTFASLLGASIMLAYAASGTVSALYVFLGAITYSVVYTVWLKRRTSWNIVVGGLAGSFAVLAGAAAVDTTDRSGRRAFLPPCCSCGPRRISGASPQPRRTTILQPVSRCSR